MRDEAHMRGQIQILSMYTARIMRPCYSTFQQSNYFMYSNLLGMKYSWFTEALLYFDHLRSHFFLIMLANLHIMSTACEGHG